MKPFAKVTPVGRAPRRPETIATAAIRVDGEVWTLPRPARHCHLIRAWSDAHWSDGAPARIGDHEQGFVTSHGRFVDRFEAARIVDRTGRLFSEDLW